MGGVRQKPRPAGTQALTNLLRELRQRVGGLIVELLMRVIGRGRVGHLGNPPGPAIGAGRPSKVDQSLAAGAWLAKLVTAGRAPGKVFPDGTPALRTEGILFEILQQVLLFQGALKALLQRLA